MLACSHFHSAGGRTVLIVDVMCSDGEGMQEEKIARGDVRRSSSLVVTFSHSLSSYVSLMAVAEDYHSRMYHCNSLRKELIFVSLHFVFTFFT